MPASRIVIGAVVWLGVAGASQSGDAIRCSADSNVTCPAESLGCVPEKLGLKWGCNMPNGPGHSMTCYTGAPWALDTNRKNVLIIGDSVSNGYYGEAVKGGNVPEMLSDIALVQHAPWSMGSGGAGSTAAMIPCMEIYLRLATGAEAAWDLISFNFGLHNLHNETHDIDLYEQQLTVIADRLVQTGAKLQYHLTTPMMPMCCKGSPLNPAGEGSDPPAGCNQTDFSTQYHCEDVVLELNRRASTIMLARGIPVVDLHSAVTAVCGQTYSSCPICRKDPCSFHYSSDGYVYLSNPVAASMRASLQSAVVPSVV